MKFIKQLAKFLFGMAIEPQKDKIKNRLDEKSKATNSDFVKKRNEVEKLLIDMVDEKTVDRLMDEIDKRIKK